MSPGGTVEINTAIALKLHAFGLTSLHDPNWTGQDMFYHVKEHIKGREEPYDLLRKTLRNGLLYQIGQWLLEDYFFSDAYRMKLGHEYRFWYLEDLTTLLDSERAADKLVLDATAFVDRVNGLYTEDESAYWKEIDSEDSYDLAAELIENYESTLRGMMPEYAKNYAERVFHDRQLCEHISKTLIVIGFDGNSEFGQTPRQWVDRQEIPSWASRAVVARDRGQCAKCGAAITLELHADPHIDHIIPLARGGTNDLVNLQLLCDDCNLKKNASLVDVSSSVPSYLAIKRSKKRQDKTNHL